MFKLPEKTGLIEAIEWQQAILLFLFCFPLFFQLSGSVFVEKAVMFDSQGDVFRLPLPLASVFCFIGIAFLLRLEENHLGMGFVFSLFIVLMLSSIVSVDGKEGTFELGRFIHLVQVILPSFALVFGHLYVKPKTIFLRFETILLVTLLLIIPLEVIASVSRGNTLSAYLYIFSLYQNFQYLTVIFVGMYFLTAAAFFKEPGYRYLVLFLAPWMGMYIALSISISTMLLSVLGSVVYVWKLSKNNELKYAIALVSLLLVSFLLYSPVVQNTSNFKDEFGKIYDLESSAPVNIMERLEYWKFYGTGVIESPKVFLFGHPKRLDRRTYPSAQNYYLDLIYNFGFVALLPYLYLIVVSIQKCWIARSSRALAPDLIMLMALVGYFVFIDSMVKVGFRQPYPGMMMFFLWGMLLVRVSKPVNVDNKMAS